MTFWSPCWYPRELLSARGPQGLPQAVQACFMPHAKEALRRGATCMCPFDGPIWPALKDVWQQAWTQAPELWDARLAGLDDT
jgi:hypothetical protein